MARRWLLTALAGLIPLIYVSAFLAMAWDRSQQGDSEAVDPSEIDALASTKSPPIRWRTPAPGAARFTHTIAGSAMGRRAKRTVSTPASSILLPGISPTRSFGRTRPTKGSTTPSHTAGPTWGNRWECPLGDIPCRKGRSTMRSFSSVPSPPSPSHRPSEKPCGIGAGTLHLE